MAYYLGVDLGGTHLRAAVIDIESGELLALQRVLTLADLGHEAVLARMAGLVTEAIAASGKPPQAIGGIGVGVPGSIDPERGTIKYLPNLAGHWPDVPVVEILRQATGLPAHLINDVRAITLGEWTYGAGRGASRTRASAIAACASRISARSFGTTLSASSSRASAVSTWPAFTPFRIAR